MEGVGQRRAEWNSEAASEAAWTPPALLGFLLLINMVINTMTKKQLGEERDYSAYLSCSQSQERGQEPWRSAACWFALHGLLSSLPHRSGHHLPRGGAAHSGLDCPTWTINLRNAPQTFLQVSLMEAIPQLMFPHPR